MPVVFLPGWGFHASLWEAFTKQLTDNDIHYADLPYIENEHETFDSITEKLNETLPDNSTLIAWSLGGLFAIALCYRFPEKYKKLILVASTPRFLEDTNWKGISQTQANSFLIESDRNLPHLINHFHRLICYPGKDPSLRTLLQKHTVTHELSLRFYLKLLFETDLREQFKSLKQPIIQIAAEKDTIVSVNSPDHIITGAGHALPCSLDTLFVSREIFPNKATPHHLFNKSAHTYDQHATLQHHVGKKLISLLPKNIFTHVIDLGCGTGATTEQLALSIEYENFRAVDAAPDSLKIASSRLHPYSINTAETNFDLPLLSKFNLIFSNMALHWSKDFQSTLNHIYQALSDEGLAAFTIPLDGTFIELTNLYSINANPSLSNVLTLLKKSGFDVIHSTQESRTYHFDNTLEALRSIRQVGATHVTNRNQYSLSGKNKLFTHPITQLTYQIGYFFVKRAS